MTKKKNFEDKVRGMKHSDIVMAMIKGLTNPKIIENPKFIVDMSTYGSTNETIYPNSPATTCYGCAATITIMQLSNHIFNVDEICNIGDRTAAINAESFQFVDDFESAIDDLRQGTHYLGMERAVPFEIYFDRMQYVSNLPQLDVKAIYKNVNEEFHLECLNDDNFEKELPAYEKLAKILKKAGY